MEISVLRFNSLTLDFDILIIMNKGPFLQTKGGYRSLRVYQIAEIIYDVTHYFTDNYFKKVTGL